MRRSKGGGGSGSGFLGLEFWGRLLRALIGGGEGSGSGSPSSESDPYVAIRASIVPFPGSAQELFCSVGDRSSYRTEDFVWVN